MSYYNGGLVCVDSKNKIVLKYGENVVPISAMCVTGRKLILGCGMRESSYPNFPNLFVFDEERVYERGAISGGESPDTSYVSSWESKVFMAKNDRRLRLQRFVVAHYARTDLDIGYVHVDYKLDDGDWVNLINESPATDGKMHILLSNKTPKATGFFWQFRFYADKDFEVLWWYPYFTVGHLGTKGT